MDTAALIRQLLNRRARLEDRSVAEQVRLLQATRRDILAELLSPHGRFDDFRFRSMIKVVDRMITDASARSGVYVGAAVKESWSLGLEFGAIGVPRKFLYDISGDLLNAIISVTRDSANDIWLEAGRAIKNAVRRSALGVDNLDDSIRSLARSLRSPKSFGTVENRAEAIMRTEVNRTFAMANDAQQGSAAAVMGGGGFQLLKYWLTAEDARTRETHEIAGETYDKAHPIPQDEPFIVGGESLMYPLDPSGSPGNTIRCRCVSVPVVKETISENYNPNQPRDPAGSPTGGQWTAEFADIRTMPPDIEGFPIEKRALGGRVLAIGSRNGILINSSRSVAPIWKDMAAYQKKAFESGWMSSPHPNHTIWHELGHAKFKRLATVDQDSHLSNLHRLSNPHFHEVAGRVSRYAQRNGHEFVAEVFAGVKAGRQFDDGVMGLYKRLNGPSL